MSQVYNNGNVANVEQRISFPARTMIISRGAFASFGDTLIINSVTGVGCSECRTWGTEGVVEIWPQIASTGKIRIKIKRKKAISRAQDDSRGTQESAEDNHTAMMNVRRKRYTVL